MFAIQSLPTSVIAFILEELSVQSFSLMRHQYGLLMVWGNEGDDGNCEGDDGNGAIVGESSAGDGTGEDLVLTISTAELSTRPSSICARVDHTRNSTGVVPSKSPQPISSAPMNEPSFGLTRVSPGIWSPGFTSQARPEISTFSEANAAESVSFRPPSEMRAVTMPDTFEGSVENGSLFSGRVWPNVLTVCVDW